MARRTKIEAEETRQEILLAALDVLTEKGFSRTTFVDIAKRIGMTKGAVYWHFENKQALLAALIRKASEQVKTLLGEQAVQVNSLDDLHRYLVARIRIATQEELCRKFAFFILLQMEWSADTITAVRKELMQFREEPFEDLDRLLAQAQGRGELRNNTDIALAKDMLMGVFVGGLTTHFQGICSTDPVDAADAAFGTVIDSLRP